MLATLGSIASQGKGELLVWDSSLGTINCNVLGLPIYNSKSPHTSRYPGSSGFFFNNTSSAVDSRLDVSSLNIKAKQIIITYKSIYKSGELDVNAGVFIQYTDGTRQTIVQSSTTIPLTTQTIDLDSNKTVNYIYTQWNIVERGDRSGDHITGFGYVKFIL